MKIKRSEIADECLICPYCMEKKSFDDLSCCGESKHHFEKAYELDDGSLHFADEVEVEEDVHFERKEIAFSLKQVLFFWAKMSVVFLIAFGFISLGYFLKIPNQVYVIFLFIVCLIATSILVFVEARKEFRHGK